MCTCGVFFFNRLQRGKEIRKQVFYSIFFYFIPPVEICWSILVCKHDIDSTICTYYTKVLTVFVVSRTSLVFQYNWILVFIHFCDWIKIDWNSGFHMYVERIVQHYCHMSWCLTYSKKILWYCNHFILYKRNKCGLIISPILLKTGLCVSMGYARKKTWHSCKCLCSLEMVSMRCVK